jgi:tRNA A-37 threonylcarbamoyl transferase component Bud32
MQPFPLELGPLEIVVGTVVVLVLVAVVFGVRRARRRRARVTVRLSVAPDLQGEFRLRVSHRPLSSNGLERLDPRVGRRARLGGRIYGLAQGQRLGFIALAPGTWYVAAAGSVSDPVTDEQVGELREERRVHLGPREAREVLFEVQPRVSSRVSGALSEGVDEDHEPERGPTDVPTRELPVQSAPAQEPPTPNQDEDPTETSEGETPAVPPPSPAPERYETQEELGRGSLGVVFRARDRQLDRSVALRRLVVSSPIAAGRELLGLDHPNIARLYDVAEQDGVWLVTSELIDGATLRSRVLSEGAFAVPDLLHVARQALAGLAHGHGLGVVHGNLGNQNLVLREDGVLKILDFGLARVASAVVTPEEEDRTSDLRAFGACLFELATGELPQPDLGLGKPSRELVSGLPPFLEEVIFRLLIAPRAARFQSANQVLELLDWLEQP